MTGRSDFPFFAVHLTQHQFLPASRTPAALVIHVRNEARVHSDAERLRDTDARILRITWAVTPFG
ncbi:hypothetical protein [uncultured Roseobacter sp.]|uniref:hypothetical protein n=1 Tax=uncultured Roseobacter sp. TaxID=114847 RepID=UPI00260D4C18|nr:hypothetical protein [uncultured Roseobacter sp.]